MLATHTTIEQVYLVPEIAKQLTVYDRLRWYRSTTGRTGYYEAATAEIAEPAVLIARQLSRALAGTTLRLRINGVTELSVPFTGANPVEALQVGDAIQGLTPDLEVAVERDVISLSTVLTGTGASIEVLEGDAAAWLGLSIGEGAVGRDADSLLLAGKSEYRFMDQQSASDAFYQVEFRSTLAPRRTTRSAPFQSRLLESVPLQMLIGCFVRLCDLTGRPLGGRRIYVHNLFLPNRVESGEKRWGLFREYEELITDANGYAEILLLRGATIDLTISGTGFTRRITIPTTGTIVDLLDPTLETRDEFGIQTPAIDFAIRTS